MIVYGGISSSLNAKRYEPATDTWTDATLVHDPGHRDHHGAVWTGTEMIVWGGLDRRSGYMLVPRVDATTPPPMPGL